MKKFEELTPEECQSFLDELFEDTDIEFKQLISHPVEDIGIEYSIKSEDFNDKDRYVSISNPELLSWMYEHEVDMTMPLTRLRYDYIEMDETNSVLFEYAMEVGKIVNDWELNVDTPFLQEMGPLYAEELKKIKNLQKDLINKL